ncbi:MAG: sporulation protein [Sulfurimonas sp. RIFCSPLOWO2_12_FULL_36_74]|uniref:SPOR domain-containing protein n=1 Tax=Sulfurimonas sp. RIFCSPLOWO2_12_36_12 TaxID=1802253 RepID=UPI0008D5746A|nr:SPOR domain-containing protein [Sulfurimonas sp. RIFCSPLOWO2_12_36_12]OHD98492.1 MAG: sporulation protein [Sulfurimonas sp. RIFCSPLOWO2_02_FULL_36_28]OHE00329.1 MAG: sporulation protein [Sulfurimonas sp. RIFCSPLOWO2_12_36_12]OHE07020.1 MAG: sporulation protein [Sulfurimonas sp. RIFCSPLOWO2_12_FULL_36_74]
MEEKNELNDIILNKNSSSLGNKKIVLAVATLGIILIIVVMLMNSLASSGTENLPQAILPPEPQKEAKAVTDEPLFEDVNVVQETSQDNSSLDAIAQKLKEESVKDSSNVQPKESSVASAAVAEEFKKEQPKKIETAKVETAKVETAKPATKKVAAAKEAAKEPISEPKTTATATASGHYIQIGSFSKIEPNKKLLDSITNLGYKYKFHQVTINSKVVNKVLVGPFNSEDEARKALKNVKASVEAGAFLTKI